MATIKDELMGLADAMMGGDVPDRATIAGNIAALREVVAEGGGIATAADVAEGLGGALDEVDERIGRAAARMYKVRGSVQSYSDLPSDAQNGDAYNVIEANGDVPAGTNYVWVEPDGGEPHWDPMGGAFDTSGLFGGDYDDLTGAPLVKAKAGALTNGNVFDMAFLLSLCYYTEATGDYVNAYDYMLYCREDGGNTPRVKPLISDGYIGAEYTNYPGTRITVNQSGYDTVDSFFDRKFPNDPDFSFELTSDDRRVRSICTQRQRGFMVRGGELTGFDGVFTSAGFVTLDIQGAEREFDSYRAYGVLGDFIGALRQNGGVHVSLCPMFPRSGVPAYSSLPGTVGYWIDCNNNYSGEYTRTIRDSSGEVLESNARCYLFQDSHDYECHLGLWRHDGKWLVILAHDSNSDPFVLDGGILAVTGGYAGSSSGWSAERKELVGLVRELELEPPSPDAVSYGSDKELLVWDSIKDKPASANPRAFADVAFLGSYASLQDKPDFYGLAFPYSANFSLLSKSPISFRPVGSLGWLANGGTLARQGDDGFEPIVVKASSWTQPVYDTFAEAEGAMDGALSDWSLQRYGRLVVFDETAGDYGKVNYLVPWYRSGSGAGAGPSQNPLVSLNPSSGSSSGGTILDFSGYDYDGHGFTVWAYNNQRSSMISGVTSNGWSLMSPYDYDQPTPWVCPIVIPAEESGKWTWTVAVSDQWYFRVKDAMRPWAIISTENNPNGGDYTVVFDHIEVGYGLPGNLVDDKTRDSLKSYIDQQLGVIGNGSY